jgi:hypothetical protein
MRFTTWLLILLPAAGAGTAACSTDTFSDDGGTDAVTDNTSDNVVNGGEGGTDGKVDAPPPRFCETRDASYAFCADFDTPGDAGAGFSQFNQTPPFSFQFEGSRFVTSPAAAEAYAPSDASTGYAWIETPVGLDGGGAHTNMQVDLDIYLPTPATAGAPRTLAFLFGDGIGPPGLQFGLGVQGTGTYWLIAGDGSSSQQLAPQPLTDRWVHVSLFIVLSPTVGTVALTVTDLISTLDAMAPAAAMLSGIATTAVSPAGPYPANLLIGVITPSSAPAGPLTFDYDNVLVTFDNL